MDFVCSKTESTEVLFVVSGQKNGGSKNYHMYATTRPHSTFRNGAIILEKDLAPITLISAGQSNMDGRVPVAKLPADIQLPLADCHYCSNYTPDHDKGVFQPSLKTSDLL